jgi:guanine nucleotide-binding protein G(i) subunit alpha
LEDREEVDFYKVYNNKIRDRFISAWKDSAFQEAYKEKYKLQIFDGSDYFLNMLPNLNEEYQPTLKDLVYTRKKTLGINELAFSKNGINYKLFDVGGQKNERKKWDQVAEDTDILFYVISLNDYHKTMYEDNKTNRLEDNLNTFKLTLKNQLFKTCKIVLIFSKYDLFMKSMKTYQFKDYMKDYQGEQQLQEVFEYIKKLYVMNDVDSRIIFSEKLDFTDLENFQAFIDKIFEKIKF